MDAQTSSTLNNLTKIYYKAAGELRAWGHKHIANSVDLLLAIDAKDEFNERDKDLIIDALSILMFDLSKDTDHAGFRHVKEQLLRNLSIVDLTHFYLKPYQLETLQPKPF